MAASVRSAGTAFQTSDTATTAYALTTPADIEVGDLMIAVFSTDKSGGGTDTDIDPPPAGWAYMSSKVESGPGTHDWMGDGTNNDALIFTKIYANGDPTTFTFTDTGIAHHCVGAIVAIKDPGALDSYSPQGLGLSTSSPPTNYENISNAAPLCPDITTTVACLVLRICATARVSNDSTITAVPAGTTELVIATSGAVSTGDDVQIGVAWEAQSVAGATGTATFTLSGNESWHAYTICIDLDSLYPSTTSTSGTARSYPVFRHKPRSGTE